MRKNQHIGKFISNFNLKLNLKTSKTRFSSNNILVFIVVSTHCKIRLSKSENGRKRNTIAILITANNNNIDRIRTVRRRDLLLWQYNTIRLRRLYAFNNIIIIYISPKHSKNTNHLKIKHVYYCALKDK